MTMPKNNAPFKREESPFHSIYSIRHNTQITAIVRSWIGFYIALFHSAHSINGRNFYSFTMVETAYFVWSYGTFCPRKKGIDFCGALVVVYSIDLVKSWPKFVQNWFSLTVFIQNRMPRYSMFGWCRFTIQSERVNEAL